MLYTKIITILPALFSLTFGLALPEPDTDVEVASDVSILAETSITAYEHSNWGGASNMFIIQTQSQCYGFDGTGWSNRISSIKVAPGFRCRLWDSNSCNGDSSPDIYHPGAQELGGMNDRATSFKCYQN